MLIIQKFTFNPFYENTYLIWDHESLIGAVIDPGCYDQNEEKILSEFVQKNNLQIKYLINTHCHIDHIFGCHYMKDKYNPKFLIPKSDLPLLENSTKQSELFGLEINTPPKPDEFITEETKINLNNSDLTFLFTPGHTPGEYCIYCEKEKILISGDALFKGSIGRTDLWGGDYTTLINSIKSKILTLPDDVVVYPGHGEQTTIGDEKKLNPFLINI